MKTELTNDGPIELIEILPCPFCGAEAEKQWKGNAYTKSRGLTIACTRFGCTTKQTSKALVHDFSFLNLVASEKWNSRVSA